MTHLTKADYITILTHYGKRIPKGKTRATLKRIKGATNRLIASKLCRCVKKVSRSGKKYKSEKITIPICIASILKRRGLKLTGRFACKKKFMGKRTISWFKLLFKYERSKRKISVGRYDRKL